MNPTKERMLGLRKSMLALHGMRPRPKCLEAKDEPSTYSTVRSVEEYSGAS